MEVAHKQQAKSPELRAVMSLVRLRQQQAMQSASHDTQHESRNMLSEVHNMLFEIYNWFTEGFDTKDLQEAKALLAEAEIDRARELRPQGREKNDMTLTFEWDEEKTRTNLRKHRVSFDEAKTLFNDPFLRTFPDPEPSLAEARYVSIGLSAQGRILVISHTDREMNVRLISCRRATRTERRAYEENH